MDLDQKILVQVAFKGAIEIYASGHTETSDVFAEVAAMTDEFYKLLVDRTGLDNPTVASEKKKSSRQSTSSSKSSASSRGGSTEKKDVKLKNPDASATGPQINFLKKLLKEADIEYDRSGFDWDGEGVDFDDLTMGGIQEYIDALLS